MSDLIAVVGATGKQGGVRALAARASMFRWFSTLPAYQADFAATRALDPQVLGFAEWLVARR